MLYQLISGHVLCVSVSEAQYIQDPIQDYLFRRDIDKDGWLIDMQKLLILKCDVNNRGKPATLIAIGGNGGKSCGNFWAVYLPTCQGFVVADDRQAALCFRMDMFYPRSSEGKSGIIAYWAGKRGGDLVLFQFHSNTIACRKLASISLSNPKDRRKLEKYFGCAPHWKSIQNYPIQVMDIAALKKAGYDVDAAMKAAEPRNSSSL